MALDPIEPEPIEPGPIEAALIEPAPIEPERMPDDPADAGAMDAELIVVPAITVLAAMPRYSVAPSRRDALVFLLFAITCLDPDSRSD